MRRPNKLRLNKGFTLVEMLAVIAITSVAGTLLFSVLFTTLRGANKSESLSLVQQNGNFVLSQMSRNIRYASALISPNTCYSSSSSNPTVTSSITILNSDNYQTTYACDTSTGIIASNGASLLNSSAVAVTACSFSCQQTNAYEAPTMTITFTLNKKNSNSLTENNSPVQFQTSVSLRNVR